MGSQMPPFRDTEPLMGDQKIYFSLKKFQTYKSKNSYQFSLTNHYLDAFLQKFLKFLEKKTFFIPH